MDTSTISATLRRRAGIGSTVLLGLVAQLPVTAGAATPSSVATRVPGIVSRVGHTVAASVATSVAASVAAPVTPHTATGPGVITIASKVLSAPVLAGDDVSAGWAIWMLSPHPAATVQLTHASVTIPLTCLVLTHRPTSVNLVLPMPNGSQAFAATDTAWHPTSSTSLAAGYEASRLVPSLCKGGLLVPHGDATYTAQLSSADTKDLFAVRFHAVDVRADLEGITDCASSHNLGGLSQCVAAWSAAAQSTALALVTTVGGGAGGPVGGILPGVKPPVTLPLVLSPVTAGRSPHVAIPAPAAPAPTGAVSGVTAPPAPAQVPQAAPSQSTVLGPVPLPVPVIDSLAAGVGGALPWKWFLVLAILDLGLIVGIVIRRRLAQRERLKQQ